MDLERFLGNIVGPRTAARVVSEMEPMLDDLQRLGLSELRPWSDFFAVFKPPQWQWKHLEQRLMTNALHYRTNYLYVSLAVLALQLLMAPLVVVTVLSIAAMWVYLFLSPTPRTIVIGDVVLTPKMKLSLFTGVSALLVLVTGTLQRLFWAVFYAVVLCGAHMMFRPRSVAAKANRIYDEMKLNDVFSVFDFGNNANRQGGVGFNEVKNANDLEDPTQWNSNADGTNMRRRGK